MTDLALAEDSNLRQTGIRLLGEIPWGTHVCVFYETREDLLDTAAAYFKAGLGSNVVFGLSRPPLPRK